MIDNRVFEKVLTKAKEKGTTSFSAIEEVCFTKP
jgi:hypothetical protein